GRDVTSAQRLAEQSNICARATAMVDEACKQPLRATVDTLPLFGPGVRVGVPANGAPAELILKRWPVLEVISVQVAPNRLPWTFTTVPPTAYQIKYPVVGLYNSSAPAAAAEGGQTVLLDPCWLTGSGLSGAGRGWAPGRGHDQYVIMVQHVNGWPHAATTAAASAGDTTLAVDDCTGWVITSPFSGAPTGATGTVYDAANQEVIHVTAASAAQGPGTLTLAAPLAYAHASGVMASTLPENVGWAAIMFCISQALARGATSTTVHQIPGGPGGGGSPGPADWAKCARAALASYARII
ncbi:MAG TPA: hypothetical protein VFY14_17455, partial [Streptomyces sp.]|nr:hypothetical protein [Streptomyces sp.]